MWSNLGQKILVGLLISSLILLALMTFITHINLDRQFADYLSKAERAENKRIAETMAQYYASCRNWEGVMTSLYHLSMMSNTRLELFDRDGNRLVDTLPWLENTYQQGFLSDELPSRLPQEGNVVSQQIDLYSNAVKVGSLKISRVPLHSETALNFRSTVNHSIYATALISLIVALIIGYFLTRRLVEPIQEMTLALEEVEEGNLSRRVTVEGEDELARLAYHFNQMTESLERQQHMRWKLGADISHELRTPLTVLKSYLEAIQDGVMKPDQNTINKLSQEANRLSMLVDDLEELNRAESRAVKLENKPLVLNEIIRSRAEEMHPLFRADGIELSVDLPAENIRAVADLRALDKVITNLLNNARKYTNPGGQVTVSLSGSNRQAYIKVADTGVGIDQQDLPHIFERFYRADPSRCRKTGGTGIGLAIVKELLEAMNGQISVESRSGAGSTFTIALPQG